jgi:hypothetical protein
MSIVADINAIAFVVLLVGFSLWMLKETFTDKS